jgi:4-amino-4-deoxy-L-arabinose transferase-like glycosyltransferase
MPEITSSRPRSGSLLLLAILLLSIILNALPLWWGLPSSTVHTWAFDEIAPDADGRTVESRHMGRYPPLHYYILGALYSPVRFLDAQGMIELSQRQLRTTLQILGRSLSLLLATLTVYLVYRIGRRLLSRKAARMAALLVAVTLPFVFYAKTINLEAAYVFWFTLSLLFLLKVFEHHRLRDYLLLGACAAFAVCTKDQAYGLYLALPPLLAGSLHSHLFATRPTLRTVTRTLVDRRIILGTAVSVSLFVLIHNLVFDFEGFLRHLRVMTGPGSEPSRIFEHSIAGHLGMLALAWRHLVFSMGWPAIVAAAAGIALAARRWRRHKHLLALLLPIGTYYLFFIAVILYHRVRFFLPVCVVLALFAGFALNELWATERVRRSLASAAIIAVALLPLLRAVSLDLSMLGDSRYFVEDWLRENLAPDERALVIGNHEQRLPRGFGSVPWRQLIFESTDLLRRRDAAFLAYNPEELRGEEEIEMERRLLDGSLNYKLAYRYRHRPLLDLIDTRGVSSNLVTVNPEIAVLERIGTWGMSDEEIEEALLSLNRSLEPKLWVEVRDAIENSLDLRRRRRLGTASQGFGLHYDAWTRGTTPAALVVSNDGDTRLQVQLHLTCATPNDTLPQAVQVVARNRTLDISFSKRGRSDIRLPPVAPGKTRMYLLTTDREWTAPETGRRLGIHVRLSTAREE